MANPYQSAHIKHPTAHNDKVTAKEWLIIIAVLAIMALAYGYYREIHKTPTEPVPVASTSGTTSDSSVARQ